MKKTVFDTICAVSGGLMAFLFGTADFILCALIAFVVIDYATGVVAAVFTKSLSSNTGFRGIVKKVMIFAVVAVANLVDTGVNSGGVLRSVVVGFFIANEGLSILENAGKMGVPIPDKLLLVLKQLRDNDENDDEKKGEKNKQDSE